MQTIVFYFYLRMWPRVMLLLTMPLTFYSPFKEWRI